jgi:hypothetical protein
MRRVSWARLWGVGVFTCVVGCTGNQVGESNPGNDAGAAGGGGGSTGGQHGAGPNGSLPSGYCCQADQDCRYRTCLDLGSGVKTCSDPCTVEEACNAAPGLTCEPSTERCKPIGAPTCIPADQWVLGPKAIGDCCVPTFDGQAGSECQGNLCISFHDISNPYICSQACDAPKDCPPGYSCNQATRFCWPLAETYACQ